MSSLRRIVPGTAMNSSNESRKVYLWKGERMGCPESDNYHNLPSTLDSIEMSLGPGQCRIKDIIEKHGECEVEEVETRSCGPAEGPRWVIVKGENALVVKSCDECPFNPIAARVIEELSSPTPRKYPSIHYWASSDYTVRVPRMTAKIDFKGIIAAKEKKP